MSEDCQAKLFAALAEAQREIEAAHKDSQNPYFRSKYADLASCWDACREPLSKNGLSIIQFPSVRFEALPEPIEVKRDNDKPPVLIHRWQYVMVRTLLAHKDGGRLESAIELVCSNDTPQAAGSAITYARRYSLCAMVGIAPDDDDANGAIQPMQRQAPAKAQPKAKSEPKPPSDVWLDDYEKAVTAAGDEEALKLAEFNARPHFEAVTDKKRIAERIEAIKKAKAAKRSAWLEPELRRALIDQLVEQYGQERFLAETNAFGLRGDSDSWPVATLRDVADKLKESGL